MRRILIAPALVALAACHLDAQSLATRVASARDARAQFTFAARDGVCGNGRSFIQVAATEFYGSWNDDTRREACVAGPVRVVLDLAGGDVISLATFAGPVPPADAGITDLGRVRPGDATEFLLGLAERAQGRVSRDAIFPAALADSVDIGARLLAIARNQDAARETRRSAITWLSRSLDGRAVDTKSVASALVSIARDEDDNQSVRQQSLRTLARLEHGAGMPMLIALAKESQGWLAREALGALASSGDPRGRQYLRDVVKQATASDDLLATAIRGLGGEYATGGDITLVRDAYAKLAGDRARDAAISAIATFGGKDNVAWLMALARSPDQPVDARRRAVQYAYRGGATVAELSKVFDTTTDPQLKESVIAALAESGDAQALEKLMQVATSDENRSVRRRAIAALGRSSDEKVKQFLAKLVDTR